MVRWFVQIVGNCSKEELLTIIQGKILKDSIIYTDGWEAEACLGLDWGML